MLHTSKTGNDSLYFTHTLLECSYKLERVAFVGRGRDKAQASFLKPLKGCTFLPCEKHVGDDITKEIGDLGLSAVQKEILEDIFGGDSKLEKGIINSESGEEFLVKVESVSAKWDKLEEDIKHPERHCDMKIDGIVPFPNSKDKRLIISLSRPISHTVEVKAKNLTCSECPR